MKVLVSEPISKRVCPSRANAASRAGRPAQQRLIPPAYRDGDYAGGLTLGDQRSELGVEETGEFGGCGGSHTRAPTLRETANVPAITATSVEW